MDESTDKAAKIRISLTLTKVYVDALDQLIDAGVYATRVEVIKDGLRRVFRSHEMPPFAFKKIEEQ